MEHASLIMEIKPEHADEIVTHITENLEEQHRLNFITAQEKTNVYAQ